MSYFVIYDQVRDTLYRAPRHYANASFATLSGAKGVATRLNKKDVALHNTVGGVRFVAISYDEFDRLFNPVVTVYNLLTKKPVQLRKSEVGGINDPSTERYHCF